MDPVKIGKLIYTLRREKNLTQSQLAAQLYVSDKAVSKWECGNGCPDLSLLPLLSEALGVDLEKLLSGELDINEKSGGNMKNLSFYICPTCGNVITAMTEASVSCCGKKMKPAQPVKAEPEGRLTVERIENDYFITSEHPMEKGHYLSFVALLTGDSLLLRRQYPEWGLQVRIPALAHGRLFWYCTEHGLFWQPL
ncbi:MAG: helix-turn-helix domain-containing protein [Clostridiaceae bacterium]|nr:helix-turn-helix domain-containing protein [Clostridiaceae bacterium]